jgi:mono/diheme cytochrome c family protein
LGKIKEVKLKKIILLGGATIVAFALLIQLIPYGHNHLNPPVVAEPKWDSPQTRQLAKQACFDCHSNETVWGWYTGIAPFSWLIQHDVEEGRQRMNFSEWPPRRLEVGEVSETILRGSMPPLQYTIIHPSTNLNTADREALAQGLQATLSK